MNYDPKVDMSNLIRASIPIQEARVKQLGRELISASERLNKLYKSSKCDHVISYVDGFIHTDIVCTKCGYIL